MLSQHHSESLMMRIGLILLLAILCTGASSADDTGMVTKKSAHSARITIDRLNNILRDKGLTVAMRWSHSDRAAGAGSAGSAGWV